eukprot:333221_1
MGGIFAVPLLSPKVQFKYTEKKDPKQEAKKVIKWGVKSLESNHPLDIDHRNRSFNNPKPHQVDKLLRYFKDMDNIANDVKVVPQNNNADACKLGASAYIESHDHGLGNTVNYCPKYNQYNDEKKTEALVHEISHLASHDIKDYAYSPSGLKANKATNNAYNIAKFAMHWKNKDEWQEPKDEL